MPQYEMDGKHEHGFRKLDSFTQGYIEAAFFTSNAPGVTTEEWQATDDHPEGSIPSDVGFTDIAPAALELMVKACREFQETNAELLEAAYERGYDPNQAGNDFWYTRNGHGVGYWDRKELEPDSAEYEALTAEMIANRHDNAAWGKALDKRNALKEQSLGAKLTAACNQWGTVDLYLGDDGLVYQM